ncbi:hypothetical protein O9K63_00830 [Janibacter cremeus]|uniref:hypothetical protein n=1 Tax=Janibacter cremeus TaxID=1285192 RepID=UPI0023F8BB2A|nr:hypothetical protein [Janibacter cremeus]WEV78368.1 hypothetical protein O9K63_00830 [Janibacter cremeus]
MIAQGALHEPQAVLQLLGDVEGHVVEMAAHGRLGFVLTPIEPVALLVRVGLGPEQDPGADGDRVDQGEPGQARQQPEHQHPAVGPLHPDEDLLPDVEHPRVDVDERPGPVGQAAGAPDCHARHGRLRVIGEVLGDLCGEPARVVLGPPEGLRQRVADLLLQPLGERPPVLARVPGVDALLGVAQHPAQAVAQVVVQVRHQVGHAVTEGQLPA